MPAPKENQFWKARASHGTEKIFKTPKALWDAACEYFEWCDANPWYKHDPVKAGPEFGKTVLTPTARPYTIMGLCIFLDCTEQTLSNYGTKEGYEDYFGVVSNIKGIIYTQKFEGAAVGAFNANIIARDLGLKDATTNEHTGQGGGPIKHEGTIFVGVESKDDQSKD
jgi:hypothetical protein